MAAVRRNRDNVIAVMAQTIIVYHHSVIQIGLCGARSDSGRFTARRKRPSPGENVMHAHCHLQWDASRSARRLGR